MNIGVKMEKKKLKVDKKKLIAARVKKKSNNVCLGDLVNLIAKEIPLTRKLIKEIIEKLRDLIISNVQKHKSVYIVNLLKAEVRKTKPKKLMNPKSREVIEVPAKYKVYVSPCRALKDATLDSNSKDV